MGFDSLDLDLRSCIGRLHFWNIVFTSCLSRLTLSAFLCAFACKFCNIPLHCFHCEVNCCLSVHLCSIDMLLLDAASNSHLTFPLSCALKRRRLCYLLGSLCAIPLTTREWGSENCHGRSCSGGKHRLISLTYHELWSTGGTDSGELSITQHGDVGVGEHEFKDGSICSGCLASAVQLRRMLAYPQDKLQLMLL